MDNLEQIVSEACAAFAAISPGSHFAVYPRALVRLCVTAGSRENGRVLDPFFGSGTTGVVCNELGRECVGIELNAEYAELARERLLRGR